VVRLREGYGAQYTASVLCGSRDRRVLEQGHDRLSTWGLLADEGLRNVRDWVEQLVDQEHLKKTGNFNVLRVTEKGWKVLKGEEVPHLLKPAEKSRPAKVSRVSEESWENVDRTLFEILRELRHRKAQERGVPAYLVFGDLALRDMARRFPTTPDDFLMVHGVGQKKCDDFGAEFLQAIKIYLEEKNSTDTGI
jgi:ATP-dependent DNA helicase RecQ